MDAELRAAVRRRAAQTCEYCQRRQIDSPLIPLQIEHILPRKHGGSDSLENLALACADVAVSNDSGLLHVAAAVGAPSIGIFGPTSPWHWAPLNPLAATLQAKIDLSCRPCHKPVCRLRHHRCMQEIPAEEVIAATRRALGAAATTAAG